MADCTEWAKLTLEDIKGETLAAQVLEHVEKGDSLKLRQLAAAVRTNNITRTSINGSRFMSQVHLLNNFRRNNMLLSPATWLYRNPLSGGLVSLHYGFEDLFEGAFRTGVFGGVRAWAHANRAGLNAWQMAWKNATTYLGNGSPVMGLRNSMEVSPDLVARERQTVIDALTTSWEIFKSPSYHGRYPGVGFAVTLMNMFNAAISLGLGRLGEVFGWSGGYLPAFRLLGAGDEAVRSLAYAWKVDHEAYLRAYDELGPKKVSSGEVAKRAEEMAERSLFSGHMTSDELAVFRREHNISDEISNDELNLRYFNNLKGMPRPETDLGAIGLNRAADATFTNVIKDPIIQGLTLTRQNALVAWQLPFFKTPLNSLLWSLDRTIVPSVLKPLRKQMANASKEELAQARAQAIVSIGFLGTAMALISSGGFVGGGPRDPQAYERWARVNRPYSFRINGQWIPASRFRTSFGFGGIDPVDILGLYADAWQLSVEELITYQDLNEAGIGLASALSRMMNNKASLLNTTTMLNAMTQPDRADMARLLATSMGGILPLSGLSGAVARMERGPHERMDRRRPISADEKKALGQDPIYADHIAPLLEFLQRAGESWARSTPGLNRVLEAPTRRDWLGSEIKRPFGIPAEAVFPFMPVIQPKDPLYQWLFDAGVTTKPRPDNTVALDGFEGRDDQVKLTMTNDEEVLYRETMRNYVADLSITEMLEGDPCASRYARGDYCIPVDQFLQGRTMREALRALMETPAYYDLVSIYPGGPDQRVNKARWSARKGTQLYEPIQDIINYYDRAAIKELTWGEAPVSQGFRKRYLAMVSYRAKEAQRHLEGLSALGVQRR